MSGAGVESVDGQKLSKKYPYLLLSYSGAALTHSVTRNYNLPLHIHNVTQACAHAQYS